MEHEGAFIISSLSCRAPFLQLGRVDASKDVSRSGGMLVVGLCAGCRVIGTKQSDWKGQKVERLNISFWRDMRVLES
jgi:hypothetical protein